MYLKYELNNISVHDNIYIKSSVSCDIWSCRVLLHVGFLLELIFNHENGSNMLFRNFG
jgi:hypothetical protein